MRSAIAATIVVAAWAAAANAQSTRSRPVCSADQAGNILVTTVEYRDGYRVDAPWRVTSAAKFSRGAGRLTAELDHIIETNPLTGKRQVTPLPSVVAMTFKAETRPQLLREAATIWCATVGKAMAARTHPHVNRVARDMKT